MHVLVILLFILDRHCTKVYRLSYWEIWLHLTECGVQRRLHWKVGPSWAQRCRIWHYSVSLLLQKAISTYSPPSPPHANTYHLLVILHYYSSNCVLNLSPDKSSVLCEAFRVLKVSYALYGIIYLTIYLCVFRLYIAWWRNVFQWYLLQSTSSWRVEKEQSSVGLVNYFIDMF